MVPVKRACATTGCTAWGRWVLTDKDGRLLAFVCRTCGDHYIRQASSGKR